MNLTIFTMHIRNAKISHLLRTLFALSAALIVFGNTARLQGAMIGYAFTGVVSGLSPSNATPFSLSLSPSASVNGQFHYDTESIGVASGSSVKYQQQISSGFWAYFDNHLVTTDSFVVTVTDRVAPSTDIFSVAFNSFGTPAPTSPLFVDGTPHTAGRFSISLSGLDVFSSPALPLSLDLSSFNSNTNMLTKSSTFAGASFQLTSLIQLPPSSTPEPATVKYVSAGLLLTVVGRRYLMRRKR
jgi:hypothetical protein